VKLKKAILLSLSILLVLLTAACQQKDPYTGEKIDAKRSAEYLEKLIEYKEAKESRLPFDEETLKTIADTASTFKLKELVHLSANVADNCDVVCFKDTESIGCWICVERRDAIIRPSKANERIEEVVYLGVIVQVTKTNGNDLEMQFEVLYQDEDFPGIVPRTIWDFDISDPDPRTILGPIDSDKANMYMLFLESKDCKDYLDEDSLYFIAEAMSSLPLGEIKYLDFAADGDCDLRDYENAKEYVFRIGDVDDNTYIIRVSKEGKILKISDPSGDLYVRPLDSQY